MLVLAFLVTLLSMRYGANRSFLVEAETGRIELTFRVAETTWDLPGATECAPLEVPAPPDRADPTCGAAYAPVSAAGAKTITWPRNARIAIDRRSDGGVAVTYVEQGEPDALAEPSAPPVPVGTVMIVDADAWRRMGALTFSAEALIGDDMRSGARGYLRVGRWEARESGSVTSRLRSVTEVVKQGTFASGGLVQVLKGEGPARTYGHVDRSGAGDTLSVTLLSEVGRTMLSVRHFGVEGPILIEPDWVDIAISSPLLIAMAGLLAIVASAIQLLLDALLFARSRPDRDAALSVNEDGDP